MVGCGVGVCTCVVRVVWVVDGVTGGGACVVVVLDGVGAAVVSTGVTDAVGVADAVVVAAGTTAGVSVGA